MIQFLKLFGKTIFPLGCLFFQNIKAQVPPPYPGRFDNIQIKESHPRIWIDASKTKWLREKYKGKTSDEVQALAGPSPLGMALTYHISGDEKWGKKAVERALGTYIDPSSKYYDLDTIEGKSKARSIQGNLADMAVCYDWCYPMLTEGQKKQFISQMLPLMQKSVSYKRVWRSFHNGMYANAWPLSAATLALYGHEPYANETLAFLKPELEDMMRTFDKVFPDGEWAEGMDYNRHSTYHGVRILLAIKSATGYNALASSPHIKNTAKYIMYSAKPNGLALPDDDNDWPYMGDWEHLALLMINEEFKDGYTQYFINHYPAERFQPEPEKLYAKVLWYDANIPEKPISQLPVSRIFRGKGLVITKNNWQWDKPNKPAQNTWLSFHSGDYMGDHVHNDINSFNIHYKGSIAIDAGRYDDDWGAVIGDPDKIVQSQFFNYYKRTIAHNTMLVYDPSEVMSEKLLNDGGQLDLLRPDNNKNIRNVPEDYDQGNFPSEEGMGKCDWATNPGRWDTGEITSYKATNDFMYVRGDGTKAYSPNKMTTYIRQLAFIQPNIIVVMDKVIAKKPDFKKTWLLHSINEPKIYENHSFELSHEGGRLACVPVLPHNNTIEKVGGPGNECLVGSTKFKFGLQSAFDPTALHYGEEAGSWRIEQSPKLPANEDYFLNVMMVTDKNSAEMPQVKILSETPKEINIRVSTKDGKQTTLNFSKNENPSAKIKIQKGTNVIVNEKMPDGIVLEKGRDK